jgi:hypothetical protein
MFPPTDTVNEEVGLLIQTAAGSGAGVGTPCGKRSGCARCAAASISSRSSGRGGRDTVVVLMTAVVSLHRSLPRRAPLASRRGAAGRRRSSASKFTSTITAEKRHRERATWLVIDLRSVVGVTGGQGGPPLRCRAADVRETCACVVTVIGMRPSKVGQRASRCVPSGELYCPAADGRWGTACRAPTSSGSPPTGRR